MSKKPDILERTIVAQSHLFDIENLHLRFSNGEERHFERVHGRGHGSVMIVPLLDKETVLLVREYGAGVDDYVLGFPKGTVEKEESVLSTATRELREEVGYGAHQFLMLARLSASPGYLSSVMDVMLATDLYPDPIVGDEPEAIEVVPWRLDNIDALLTNPEFHEGRSVAALLMVWRRYAFI